MSVITDRAKLEMGENTRMCYKNIKGNYIDFNSRKYTPESILEEIQIAIELNNHPILRECVIEQLKKLGCIFADSDIDGIRREIRKRLKSLGISNDEMKPIMNWISGTPTSTKNKVNNYSLCYALEMDYDETCEFFEKCYFCTPFNYRDVIDAVFFYCISNNKPYTKAKEMIEYANHYVGAAYDSFDTENIGKKLSDIEDDEEFLVFLTRYCYKNATKYKKARVCINEYITEIKENKDITVIQPATNEANAEKNADDFAKIHECVFGFNYQRHQKTSAEFEKLKLLPKRFTESLPTDGELRRIIKQDNVSYETLRKTLISFFFYDYYRNIHSDIEADDIPSKEEMLEIHDDFYVECDLKLVECGFSPLYPRNPFDAIILICSLSTDPLVTFWQINSNRYKGLKNHLDDFYDE